MSNSRKAAFIANLNPAYKFLIDNYKGELPYELKDVIKRSLRTYRRNLCLAGVDMLAARLDQYGNEGQWSASRITELARVVYDSKNPEGFEGEWISVEIECFFTSQTREKAFAKNIRGLGLSKFVTIKNDGSLNPHDSSCSMEETEDNDGHCECATESHGKEICVSFKKSDMSPLFKVCAELNKLGCWVNRTCGLHVHFDMRTESSRMVTLKANRVAHCVPALKRMLPKSRRDNRFCATAINARRGGSRYAFVNMHSLSKYGTLEIRGHSGSTDAAKIASWIELLQGIMQCKAIKSSVDSMEVVAHLVGASETLRGYIRERVAKFSPEVSSEVDQVLDDNEESTQTLPMQVIVSPSAHQLTERELLEHAGRLATLYANE